MNFELINIFKKIKFSSIFTNANKTLNIIKKSIPVYKQVKPYVTHEKSFFKNKSISKDIDIIKESKPLKDDRTSLKYNDTLTFFK